MILPGSDRGVIGKLIQGARIREGIWKREELSELSLAIDEK